MKSNNNKGYSSSQVRSIVGVLTLFIYLLISIGCSTSQSVVEKTTKTVKRTTKSLTRKIILSDEDLNRIVGILDFENNSLRESYDFQKIFHKGLPDYMSERCQGIIVTSRDNDAPQRK